MSLLFLLRPLASQQSGDVTVNLTGAQITAAAGTVSVTTTASVTVALTGAQITSAGGTVSIVGGANVTLTGASLVAAPGTLGITGGANVTLTGAEVTATPGEVQVDVGGNVTVNLVGAEITVTPGTVGVAAGANVTLTGAEITSQYGVVSVQTTGSAGKSGVNRELLAIIQEEALKDYEQRRQKLTASEVPAPVAKGYGKVTRPTGDSGVAVPIPSEPTKRRSVRRAVGAAFPVRPAQDDFAQVQQYLTALNGDLHAMRMEHIPLAVAGIEQERQRIEAANDDDDEDTLLLLAA